MKRSVLQTVDDDARRLARRLVRSSRFAALATLAPGSGDPLISRVSAATDAQGRPVILVSELSPHTTALLADPRCSLLFGEPGDGDPLAHPRISLAGLAWKVARDALAGREIRQRFLSRHPAAALYADFGDFHFFTIEATRAGLNAGFARAYELQASDMIDPPPSLDFMQGLERARDHMNADHAEAVDLLGHVHSGDSRNGWRIVTADARGFEVASGDMLCRIEFEAEPADAGELRGAYVSLVEAARSKTAQAGGG